MIEERLEGIVVVEPIRGEDGKRLVLPNAKKTIGPILDRRGNIKHGLNKEEIAHYEKLLNETLDDKYWANFTIVLTDSVKEFDLSHPWDRLAVRILRQHPWVQDIGGEINSRTVYTIKDEEAEAREKVEALNYKKKAYKYFEEMDDEDIKGFLRLFGVRVGKESATVRQSKLEDILTTNPKRFVEYYEDKNRKTRILLRELYSAGVVTKNKEHYFWGEIHIGENEDLAVVYLNDVEHQEALIGMKKELSEKKKLM